MPIQFSQKNIYIVLTLIASIAMLMIATGIGRFVFTPILPVMLDEQSVVMSDVIWLSSANYIGYFCGALFLISSKSHLKFVTIGAILVTISTYFSSLDNFYHIFLFRFLAGVGGAWALISISAWAVPLLREWEVKRVGFIYTGVGTGIAVTGVLCSELIIYGFSADDLWVSTGFLATFLCVLSLTLIAVIVRHYNKQKHHQVIEEEAVSDDQYPAVWKLALSYGLFGFGYIIPATFLPKMAKDMLTGNYYLLIWPIFGLASVIMVTLLQRFNRVCDIKIWRSAQLVMGLATLIPVFFKDVIGVMTTTILVGGMFMLVIMSVLKVASQVKRSYNVVAIVTTSFAFGQLLGPLPALFLSNDQIWQYILPLSACSSLLGVAVLRK